jgi:hypothetical protein
MRAASITELLDRLAFSDSPTSLEAKSAALVEARPCGRNPRDLVHPRLSER